MTDDELLVRADSRRNDTECRTQDRLLIADLAAALRAAQAIVIDLAYVSPAHRTAIADLRTRARLLLGEFVTDEAAARVRAAGGGETTATEDHDG